MRKILALIVGVAALTGCFPKPPEVIPQHLDSEEITWLVQRAAVKFKHEVLFTA